MWQSNDFTKYVSSDIWFLPTSIVRFWSIFLFGGRNPVLWQSKWLFQILTMDVGKNQNPKNIFFCDVANNVDKRFVFYYSYLKSITNNFLYLKTTFKAKI